MATSLHTIGAIARQLGQPNHRIDYVVRTRGIEPAGRAGHIRVFTEAAVERIASELKRMAADKEAPKW